ncbi:leukocyte elastase inhibitor-like [Cheilinus undulatus]|uniref:leukocyte elastase inhibitor-like n=1 Tax=Cheilinus undulatus TaxID=241271 RepID=UPI001BD36FE6|nr:leukocyte elastase inhibitor-like [Cheilinus undulatus]
MASTSSAPFSVAEASNRFSLAMFKQLIDTDKPANIFYSPFSISSALAMVSLGARGKTAEQMLEVLGFGSGNVPNAPTDQQMQMQMMMQTQETIQLSSSQSPETGVPDVHVEFGKLFAELNNPDKEYTLSTANRLYGEQTLNFSQDYLDVLTEHYRAAVERVDFKQNAEGVRVNINDWVEKETNNKIKNLLAEGTVTRQTVLVLVNAIYFKGTWKQQFKKEKSYDGLFRINKNENKPVTMMSQTARFNYYDDKDLQVMVLEMPYKGMDLSMLIFLPNDIEDDSTGLQKLELELTHEKFMELTDPDVMISDMVDVMLPKFKLEENYDLNEVLQNMGMVDLFDSSKSNLSGMSSAKNLSVTKVVHKAFVDVNEEGTEAAAATGVVIGVTSVRLSVSFNADHPFLFFIRHNPSKTILFSGRFCNPQ